MDILLIAIALSLDAFSVAISCGIKLPHNNYYKFFKISLFFGIFQALMPLVGHQLSHTLLKEIVTDYAKLISFSVFFLLGIKTIYDYFTAQKCSDICSCNCSGYKCLTTLAIATSIDAFLIGAILGLRNESLFVPILIIGVITFINSLLGCILGNKSITFYREKSRLVAATILILLAFKTLFFDD